jgi:SNF2 family DNA or RNA helicase
MREQDSSARTLAVVPNSVKEHWQREIQKWQGHAKPSVQIVEARTFEEDVRSAKDADWTIIGYPVMSSIGSENGRGDELRRVGYTHVILDEVHNAKNPAALRTRPVKAIADDADYLSALSGTPMPNSIVDLYILTSPLPNTISMPF